MKRKILISFMAILLISVLMMGMLSINLVKQSFTTEMEHRLTTNAELIATFIGSQHIQPEDADFEQLMTEFSETGQSRVTVMNQQGFVIYDSRADSAQMERHHLRPEVAGALQNRFGRDIRTSATTGQEMMYVAVPVIIGNQPVYVVRLSMDLSEIDALTQRIGWYLMISAVVGLLIALALGFRLIDRIIENIQGIVNMAKRMAEGDYGKRIYLDSDDELSELGDHFNRMADVLNQTIHQLSESNARFKALLTSLRNPILAVDLQKHITLMNPAAEKLFETSASEVEGKHIMELIRHTDLDDIIQEAINEQTDREIEVSIKGATDKILRIMTSQIREEDEPLRSEGLVIFMDDVTEIRKLEQIRSNFVTNVTHELKTPLTSISGFVETLKSGEISDDATRERFLDIIEIETERLTRLINDILTLSEIENIRGHEKKVSASPTEILDEVASLMTSVNKGKDAMLRFEVARNLPQMNINVDRFKQMMINLIDNAMKYTPEGGEVTVGAYMKLHKLVIRVRDTGIGIPESDLPQLFERFYRVDKARSKKMGGTGLGLAIVKHIVLSMNGTIHVNSQIGKGSEFVIQLPIDERR